VRGSDRLGGRSPRDAGGLVKVARAGSHRDGEVAEYVECCNGNGMIPCWTKPPGGEEGLYPGDKGLYTGDEVPHAGVLGENGSKAGDVGFLECGDDKGGAGAPATRLRASSSCAIVAHKCFLPPAVAVLLLPQDAPGDAPKPTSPPPDDRP